jgi:hypothetical protein
MKKIFISLIFLSYLLIVKGQGSVITTLPKQAGHAGQFLSTNGSKTAWATAGGGSALTFSLPLINSSGTISIPQSSTSLSGYLSSTDWNTFNGKQNHTDTASTTQSGIMTITDYNKMVYNTPATGLTFSGVIDLTSHVSSNYNDYTMSGVLSITIASTPKDGSKAYLVIIGNGSNTPSFSGLYLTGGYFDATLYAINDIEFKQVGNKTYYSISQAILQ